MAQGTTYIKTTDRRGNVLWEGVWCAECVATHRKIFGGDKKIKIDARPWGGEVRPCGSCDDSENAPEFKLAPVVALALVLLVGGTASAQTAPIIVGSIADAVSTEIAIATGAGREGNYLLGENRLQRLVTKSIGTASLVWLVKTLERQGKPKAAKIVGYTFGLGLSALAARNVSITVTR